jgi:hypothetical protein
MQIQNMNLANIEWLFTVRRNDGGHLISGEERLLIGGEPTLS